METIRLRDEYIKLGQALKATGMVESGVEAKEVIQEGLVMVNGETDTRRGRKLYGGDVVLFDGEERQLLRHCGQVLVANDLSPADSSGGTRGELLSVRDHGGGRVSASHSGQRCLVE